MAMDAAFQQGPQNPSPTRVRDIIARRAAVRSGHRVRSPGVSGGWYGKFPGIVGAPARRGGGNRKHTAAGGAPALGVGEFLYEAILDSTFGPTVGGGNSCRGVSLGSMRRASSRSKRPDDSGTHPG